MPVPDAAKMTRNPQTDATKRNIAQFDLLSNLQNLLSSAFSNRPPEANINLKANPDIENRKQQKQEPLAKQIESSLDPTQLAVLKAIQKKASEQAVEAIDQGVPPEHILGKMGIPTQQTQQEGQQPQQGFNGINIQNAEGFKGLFQQRGMSVSPDGTINIKPGGMFNTKLSPNLAEAEILQRLTGQTPLQAKDKLDFRKKQLELQSKEQEKFQIRVDDFFDNIINPKPESGETAAKFGFYDSSLTSLNQLEQILSENPNALTSNKFSQIGKRVQTLLDNIKANLSPARGGANLSEQELKLVESIIPKRGIKAFFQDSENRFKLESLKNILTKQIDMIRPNQQLSVAVKELLNQGYSREEITKLLVQRGIL